MQDTAEGAPAIPITVRQLEAIIRISESLAKVLFFVVTHARIIVDRVHAKRHHAISCRLTNFGRVLPNELLADFA